MLVLALFPLACPSLAWAADSSSAAAASGGSASAESSASSDDKNKIDEDNLVDPTQRADNSFIYDTTIETLFEQASLYDGRTVQIVGEVIGDKIASNDPTRSWITLTTTDEDNKSTISVYLSSDQTSQIDHYGRYGVTGTLLQVRGTYHQVCSEHQGIPDIHASDASRTSRGIEHRDAFKLADFVPGIVAVCVGLAMMGVYYYARERSR